MDIEKLKTEFLHFLPPGVALVTGIEIGDPVTASLAALTLFTEGASKLREMNKSFLEQFATNDDVIEELRYFIKTPEFIQFFREVLIKVAYETREENRKALLHAAWNYILKDKKFTFDEKVTLLSLLDNLSALEVSYLILLYSNKPIPEEIQREIEKLNSNHKLASLGLLDTDYSSIQEAFEKLNKDVEEFTTETEEIFRSLPEKLSNQHNFFLPHSRRRQNYNSFFNQVKIKFEKNELGRKFVELIVLEEIL